METTEPLSTIPNEHPSPPAVEETRVVKKRRGFWRRTGIVVVWILFISLVLESGTALFIQLPVFRRLVVNELASIIENGTNGKLTVGDIQGNLLEGFVMSDVTLRLKTGTAHDSIPLVHVDRIIANYSLLHWIRTSEIGISSLVLQNPVVRLVKFAGDTTWNYSRLIKPNTSKVPSKPFSEIIDLANMQIHNGSFLVRDYNDTSLQTAVATSENKPIDWNDIAVQGIDLDGRFYVHGAASDSVHVSHLQFRETHSGLFVQRFGFSAYLDSTQARIENAKIITGHSDLAFSIQVSPPKIIETGLLTSMQHSSVKASVNGSVISTNELKQFLPIPLAFLGGSPGIDLAATGEFGKLHIQKLKLDFRERGNIAISGDLDNLHQADSLTMNLDLHAKNLSNGTLDEYVPGLHLPDLTRFGTIDIPNLTFNGSPKIFHTKFDATSSGAGSASADATFDLQNKEIIYRAGVKTNNFNVAALEHSSDLESSITAEINIIGHGTNWKTMESTIAAKTDGPSTWTTHHVTSLDLNGGIKRGTMTVNHLDLVVEGGPEAHIRSATAAFTTASIPFHFDGWVKNFPLAQVLGNRSQNPARIDLDANITGTAENLDTVTGTAHLRVFDLEYQGHALPEDTAEITIAADRMSENKLSLHSSIADLTVDRKFQIGDFIHVIPEHVKALLTAIENRDFPRQEELPPLSKTRVDSVDFDYRLQIKDLRPLVDFLPQDFLLAQGIISGTVSGSAHGDLNMTANGDSVAFILRNRLSIDSNMVESLDSATDSLVTRHTDTAALSLPKFGAGTPRIQLLPTTFRFALHDLSNDPRTALGHLDASLDFLSDSVVRLGSALFYHPHIGILYKNEALDFNASSLYNNALGINITGNARFPNGDLDVALNNLKLTYKNPFFTPTSGSLREFVWRNDGAAHIHLAKSGLLQVDTLHIVHPMMNDTAFQSLAMQRINFGGTLSGDSVNAWVSVPLFRLEDLRKILPFNQNAKTFDFAKYQGKIRDLQLALSGTLEEPDISAKLFADSMTYHGTEEDTITFDSNYVSMEYRDQILRGIMDLHVANATASEQSVFNPNTLKGSELRATIDSIPIAIALKRGPDYAADSTRAAAKPLSASIRTTKFPLDIATPFLPPFRQILGTGDINFTVNGTRENIQYAGQASVQNGELELASTNMWYLFGGRLAFAHDSLVLQNDSIRNISTDDSSGSARLNGSFTFKGFDVTNFDLRLRSNRIMVLSDAAKESLPVAYGTVVINTGDTDLRFYNTFDAPILAGTINIMSANVTMPISGNVAQSSSNQGILYETLPPDSAPHVSTIDTLNTLIKRVSAEQAASIEMNETDDTLFPNVMKDIYRDDTGTAEDSNLSQADLQTPQSNVLAPSFTDKLRMHLSINTVGAASLTIPFGNGAFGGLLLGSQIKADLKSGGTVQIERGDDFQTQANGNLELSPTSTFTFLQTFTITNGAVFFTHDFGNPNIDISAQYIGTHIQAGQSAFVQAKVVLHVTGTKDHPTITAENSQQSTTGGEFELKTEPSPEIAVQDAIYFLYTGGYFLSDNNARNNVAGQVLPNLGNQAVSNVAANLFGNITGTLPFSIRGATFGTGNNAGAQITGSYRDITFKIGGGYGSFGTNIVDIPASTIPFLSDPAFHNMLFEVQVNPNPYANTTAGTVTQQPYFLSKIIYTFPLNW